MTATQPPGTASPDRVLLLEEQLERAMATRDAALLQVGDVTSALRRANREKRELREAGRNLVASFEDGDWPTVSTPSALREMRNVLARSNPAGTCDHQASETGRINGP